MKIVLSTIALVLLFSGLAVAGTPAAPPQDVPALAPWGMIGSAAALGISGLYFIIKRHK
jgi:hypothetical protein